MLLGTGVLLGPVFGVVNPSEQLGEFEPALISIAVAIVLFEGGLSLDLAEARYAGAVLWRLIISGLVAGFAVVTLCGVYAGGLSWATASVLGAILVVTGPTVILPMLRQARISLRPATLLKWEGIVNDPLGALLAFVVFQVAVFDHSGAKGIPDLLLELGLAAVAGGALGVVAGFGLGRALDRGHIAEHMKSTVILAAVLVVFSAAEAIGHENGLFAVTAMGIVLANIKNHSLEDIRKFKEQIGTLLVAFLFLVLSARLTPDQLRQLLEPRIVVLVVLILFVARPIVGLLATWRTSLPWSERTLIGWIAPRGVVAAAVAGAFEPRLIEAGYDDASRLVPIVFGVILSTVVLHGLTIRPVSRKLGLGFTEGSGILIVGAQTWGVALAQALLKAGAFVVLVDSRYQRVSHARREGVEVHYGDVLSEETALVLPLERVSRVLAATDDDAYNSLVCMSFAQHLGRAHAVQVTPSNLGTRKETSHHMMGSTPWGDAGTYVELSRRYWRRGSFKVTKLSEEFGSGRPSWSATRVRCSSTTSRTRSCRWSPRATRSRRRPGPTWSTSPARSRGDRAAVLGGCALRHRHEAPASYRRAQGPARLRDGPRAAQDLRQGQPRASGGAP